MYVTGQATSSHKANAFQTLGCPRHINQLNCASSCSHVCKVVLSRASLRDGVGVTSLQVNLRLIVGCYDCPLIFPIAIFWVNVLSQIVGYRIKTVSQRFVRVVAVALAPGGYHSRVDRRLSCRRWDQ